MATLGDWISAARPKTLGAAVAPVAVGTVLAWRLTGQFSGLLLLCTLGSCLALQVATNFFNDALDFMKGADTSERVGPRRITAAGAATATKTMRAGALVLLMAMLLSVPLILERGWPIIAIGLPSLYFCYGYTGGPHPLAYRGLGELFVILFFGLVAVVGTFFVQTGEWSVEALVAGVQIGCLSTVLIAINNLRDVGEDAGTGKRTLAVRFGLRFARWEILLLMVAAYAVGGYWWLVGLSRGFWLPLLLLPLAGVIARGVFGHEPGRVYNRWLALSGLQLLAFALLWCVGIWSGPQVG
jgi:1,4-dihydroxy-2-naphthoate octaprenyltransferase